MSKDIIPNDARYIIDKLKDVGQEAFLIGGFVRDYALGKTANDVDIVTSATPDELSVIFKSDSVKTVGAQFGVVIVRNIEIATYRKDIYFCSNDSDNTFSNVKVKYAESLREDMDRRDFTINAMAMCPTTLDIIDYHNGLNDLKHKLIKFVGDPIARVFEDPNRILRACRFVSLIDGKFDKNTERILRNQACLSAYVAKERIRIEIFKAMKTKKASKFFKALSGVNILSYVFPELDQCIGWDHGPHHYENVFEHSMLTGDAMSIKYPLLKLGGYLHDIGKTASCAINPKTNDLSFKGHHKTGAKCASKRLKILKFSNDEINFIDELIFKHMKFNDGILPKTARKVLRNLKYIAYKDLMRLLIADKIGNIKAKDYTLSNIKHFIKIMTTEEKAARVALAVDGYDVMNVLNIAPGKEVGNALKRMEEVIIEDPSRNTREHLLSLLTKGVG